MLLLSEQLLFEFEIAEDCSVPLREALSSLRFRSC
jgi:hypothetical protein